METQGQQRAGWTPGPWIYKALAGHHDYAVYAEGTGAGGDIALVRDFNEANARVVASAPALVEALRELVQRAEDTGLTRDGSNQDVALADAVHTARQTLQHAGVL